MRLRRPSALLGLLLLTGAQPGAADDVVYVTDLAIYTLLAPCAQSALKYNVMSMTYEFCPEDVAGLQSCVCSKNNYASSVANDIVTDVSGSCGNTATADQASASTVFSVYCNQGADVAFPTPTVSVSQYVTDIPEISYLAPCAASALRYAVMSMTYDLCPSDAANLATCACQKNQNSLLISQSINSEVKDDCSSQTVNIASAQAFFSAYCNLNNGTSSFPVPPNPPGDMTYYITDMPAFGSLVPCARSALSEAVFSNTYELCPEGPQLLASCACIQSFMPSFVASGISSNMEFYCTTGDTDDISSALDVFSSYCRAANNLAVVTGVTASVSQTRPFGAPGPTATGPNPKATGKGGSTGGSGSGSGSGGGSGSNGGSNGGSAEGSTDGGSNGNGSSSSSLSTGAIVGIVIGVVGGLAALAVAAVFVFRHSRRKAQRSPPGSFQQLDNLPPAPPAPSPSGGKSELAGAAVAGAGELPGANATTLASPAKYEYSSYHDTSGHGPPPSSVSPVSGHHQPYPGPPNQPYQPELPGQGYPFPPGTAYTTPQYAELPGQQTYAVPHVPQQPSPHAELYGGGQPGYGQPAPYGAPPPPHQSPPPTVYHQADSRPVQAPAPGAPATPAAASPTQMTFQAGPVPQL